MKKAMIGIILSIGVLTCRADPLLEAAFDAELVVDYAQTRSIHNFCLDKHDGRVGCTVHETNGLLGQDPSEARIRNYFLTAAATHALITYVLPEEYKKPWQIGTIVFEGVIIGRNKHLGLKLKF
jgi:hypothetical protein